MTRHYLWAPARQRTQFGVAIPAAHLTGVTTAVRDARLDHVVRCGAVWLRTDAYWSALQTGASTYAWSGLDGVVDAARARGLRVILAAHTTPAWARPAGQADTFGPASVTEQDRFAAFCGVLAARYAGRVAAIEVWNEPNLDQFWSPTPSPASYGSLLTKAAAAIRVAAPGVAVVAGGTGGVGTGPDIDPLAWYESLCNAVTIAAVCDAVAVHPYTNNDGLASGGMAQAVQIRELLDARGARMLPMWATETGAPTAGSDGGTVTEAVQASLVETLARAWAQIRVAGPMCWYTLLDTSGTTREEHFGVLRLDGTDKPAVAALKTSAAATLPAGVTPAVRYAARS